MVENKRAQTEIYSKFRKAHFYSKNAQTELSFGMIFSIILIIAFVAFAFYGIKAFLDFRNEAQTAQFVNDIQKNIDAFWAGGAEGTDQFQYMLPSKIKKVCFYNIKIISNSVTDEGMNEQIQRLGDKTNMFFYPVNSGGKFAERTISHLNIDKTNSVSNPLCLDNKNGKVKLILEKNYGENVVTVIKA